MALSVIGAGKWGEALFNAFKINYDIKITSRTKRNIKGFVSLDEALKSEYLVISIATQSLKEFLKKIDLKNKKILVASKGIDKEEFKFINEIYEEYVNRENLAYIGGPSFAK
jgi:glycerol-3-phosphate dehydrogenase (NAD(P)+)